MRRSLLFIPGNAPAMLANADVFGADAVILDLEDAVAVAEKDAARDLVASYLSTWPERVATMVRVNGLGTPWLDRDLEAVLSPRLAAVVFPKADPEALAELDRRMLAIESRKGIAVPVPVVAIVESARGVLAVDTLAFHPRLTGILLGGEDLTADLGILRTKAGIELAYPRARIAMACRAAGIAAIDAPFGDVADEVGFRLDALAAKGFGFVGKALIHPNQIEATHAVFSPSEAEIVWARRVRAAARDAEKRGLGVFSLDGRMIDKPVILRADNTMRDAIACGLAAPGDEE